MKGRYEVVQLLIENGGHVNAQGAQMSSVEKRGNGVYDVLQLNDL